MGWLIALSIFLFVVLMCVIVFLIFAIKSNFALQQQLLVYEDFFMKVSGILETDITFLRGALARKFPDSVPEVAEFSRGLTQFSNHIKAIQANIGMFDLNKRKDE